MFFFEYTFAFKRKSTQKLPDLPEVKENFSFPLLRKRMAVAQFDSSFRHQVLLMRWTKSIHCLDSLTNYSGCMSNLIFLASVKAVMTNITCYLSIFVMKKKHPKGLLKAFIWLKKQRERWLPPSMNFIRLFRVVFSCLNRPAVNTI